MATKKDYWNIHKYELFTDNRINFFNIFVLFSSFVGLFLTLIFEPSVALLVIIFFFVNIFLGYSVSLLVAQQVQCWIIKYNTKVVGQVQIQINKNYSRLLLLSIHPQYQNRGLGSYTKSDSKNPLLN